MDSCPQDSWLQLYPPQNHHPSHHHHHHHHHHRLLPSSSTPGTRVALWTPHHLELLVDDSELDYLPHSRKLLKWKLSIQKNSLVLVGRAHCQIWD
nr:protein kibra-like [Crassostrea gigas]